MQQNLEPGETPHQVSPGHCLFQKTERILNSLSFASAPMAFRMKLSVRFSTIRNIRGNVAGHHHQNAFFHDSSRAAGQRLELVFV